VENEFCRVVGKHVMNLISFFYINLSKCILMLILVSSSFLLLINVQQSV